jgi:predicted  nucleic acid-binding Zn-ribbon protein
MMKTIEIDMFAKLRKEIEELKVANARLNKEKEELEQRLQDLHGEYMLLRYKFKSMPSYSDLLKLRQEIQTLKKELRMMGWTETALSR